MNLWILYVLTLCDIFRIMKRKRVSMSMHQQSAHSDNMDSHMNFRMSSKDKKTIEIAAKLSGSKPNTYARQKLLEVAEQDIAKMNQLNSLVISNDDWEVFIKTMEAPVKINKKLLKAVQEFNKMYEQ